MGKVQGESKTYTYLNFNSKNSFYIFAQEIISNNLKGVSETPGGPGHKSISNNIITYSLIKKIFILW